MAGIDYSKGEKEMKEEELAESLRKASLILSRIPDDDLIRAFRENRDKM